MAEQDETVVGETAAGPGRPRPVPVKPWNSTSDQSSDESSTKCADVLPTSTGKR
ncbi:hypothetical protein [Amycolatopsis sp. NPDC051061]|uniref:hypothetical protein n=1 Tax=Amycolatopsis sp. NPDC051061 TaxID=3155042 RepID=UPI0034380A15